MNGNVRLAGLVDSLGDLREVEDIADKIKSGNYPTVIMDITQFFNKLGTGDEYSPKADTRVQVRPKDRNIKKVERGVNKMRRDGDYSKMKPLTVIYYPDTNTYKLLNGNHTSEMAINLGLKEMEVHIVNFGTQLKSRDSNAILLGDILNKVEVEEDNTENESIKLYLYKLMDENIEAGREAISDAVKKYITDIFPQVTEATVGQWISNHEKVGKRLKPQKEWTDAELENQRQTFADTLDYEGYVIPKPRTLAAWMDTGTSVIFNNCMVEGKTKALIIFYCSTTGQVDDIKNTDIKKRIKDKYAEYESSFLMRVKEKGENGEIVESIKPLKIDTVFLRYD